MNVYEWTKNEYAKVMRDENNIPIINYAYTVVEEKKVKKADRTKPVC